MSILFRSLGGVFALSLTPTMNRPQRQAEEEFLIQEPASVYHAQAKDYLSSHQLADFRKCPLLVLPQEAGLDCR